MGIVALVVLVLVLVLMQSVVAMLRLMVLVMLRSALAKGRAPSRVGIPHLLIEVGVVAGAGRAGLLHGGARIDAATTASVTSSPPPST